MQVLDRRVQVLFDQDSYDRLTTAAAQQSRSVGSLVRAAVDEALRTGLDRRREAFDRLMERADQDGAASGEVPPFTLEEWMATKNDMHEVSEGASPQVSSAGPGSEA
jgi:hypothetical protein